MGNAAGSGMVCARGTAALVLAVCIGCARESLLGVETPDADYWRGYVTDAGGMLSRPLGWEGRDWLTFGGGLGGTAALYSLDAEIRDSVLDSHSSATEGLARLGEKMGNAIVLPVGLLAGYGLGWAFDDARLKEACLLGAEGLALSALATRTLKPLFGRARPYNDLGPDEFIGFSCDDDYASFPSGHTTLAFAVATAFHLEYRNKWVSILAYTLATIGAWSRVHDDMHWASDVFAGATVGIVVTNGVFRARRHRRERDRTQARLFHPRP